MHQTSVSYLSCVGARCCMPQAWYKTLGFCGRVKHINKETPIHKSEKCLVLSGIDCDDEAAVVLKLMRDKDSFHREKNARVGLDLEEDAKFVVPIIFASDEDPERWEADAKNLAEKLTEKLEWLECPDYRYGIVMRKGARDLAVVALKERLDLPAVRGTMNQIARALAHVHSKRIVHADVKNLNLLRLHDRTWRLIDLDAAVKLGEPITLKSSLKIVPPEALAHRSMVVARATTDDTLKADATFDVWSFGTCLFELAARQPLFVANGDDGLEPSELERLFRWSPVELASAVDLLQASLSALADRNLALAAVDLISWC